MAKLFFSYSHRDEALRDELEVHLAMLKRQGVITTWHDRRIDAGAHVDHSISEHLETSDIVLLLVSPYFLASEYCYDVEMRRAMERHESGEAVVIPVILNPCDWHGAPFGRLRATPRDGKAVTKFANPHDAFLEITQEIRKVAQRSAKVASTSSAAPATAHTSPRTDVRSSNLRVRRTFSDHERDVFVDESYTYMQRFFENSLAELKARHPQAETRLKRLGDTAFTAAVYIAGEKRTACRVWIPGRGAFGGDIAYSTNESPQSSSFNESMYVKDDGYTLGLEPIGLANLGSKQGMLSQHGAAEYLWSMFVSPLQ